MIVYSCLPQTAEHEEQPLTRRIHHNQRRSSLGTCRHHHSSIYGGWHPHAHPSSSLAHWQWRIGSQCQLRVQWSGRLAGSRGEPGLTHALVCSWYCWLVKSTCKWKNEGKKIKKFRKQCQWCSWCQYTEIGIKRLQVHILVQVQIVNFNHQFFSYLCIYILVIPHFFSH